MLKDNGYHGGMFARWVTVCFVECIQSPFFWLTGDQYGQNNNTQPHSIDGIKQVYMNKLYKQVIICIHSLVEWHIIYILPCAVMTITNLHILVTFFMTWKVFNSRVINVYICRRCKISREYKSVSVNNNTSHLVFYVFIIGPIHLNGFVMRMGCLNAKACTTKRSALTDTP